MCIGCIKQSWITSKMVGTWLWHFFLLLWASEFVLFFCPRFRVKIESHQHSPHYSDRHKRLVELNVAEQCLNVYKSGFVQESRFKTGFPKIHGWYCCCSCCCCYCLHYDLTFRADFASTCFFLAFFFLRCAIYRSRIWHCGRKTATTEVGFACVSTQPSSYLQAESRLMNDNNTHFSFNCSFFAHFGEMHSSKRMSSWTHPATLNWTPTLTLSTQFKFAAMFGTCNDACSNWDRRHSIGSELEHCCFKSRSKRFMKINSWLYLICWFWRLAREYDQFEFADAAYRRRSSRSREFERISLSMNSKAR